MKRSNIIWLLISVVLAGSLVAYAYIAMTGFYNRPLFGEWVSHGLPGWRVRMPLFIEPDVEVFLDDELNILMVSLEKRRGVLRSLPDYDGIIHLDSGVKRVPIWNDSAVLYDDDGIVSVVFLEKAKASEIFEKIKSDPAEIDRLFDHSVRPIR